MHHERCGSSIDCFPWRYYESLTRFINMSCCRACGWVEFWETR